MWDVAPDVTDWGWSWAAYWLSSDRNITVTWLRRALGCRGSMLLCFVGQCCVVRYVAISIEANNRISIWMTVCCSAEFVADNSGVLSSTTQLHLLLFGKPQPSQGTFWNQVRTFQNNMMLFRSGSASIILLSLSPTTSVSSVTTSISSVDFSISGGSHWLPL